MEASPPRRVRRVRPTAPGAPSSAVGHPTDPSSLPSDRRRLANRAATGRARRLTLLYAVALGALYLAFALLDRASAAYGSSGATTDLDVFGGVAVVLAFAGAFLTLGSAPSAVEVEPEAIVVVGAYGTRRPFRRGPGLTVKRRRRYGAGLLAAAAVDSIELAERGTRRTYLLDADVAEAIGATDG